MFKTADRKIYIEGSRTHFVYVFEYEKSVSEKRATFANAGHTYVRVQNLIFSLDTLKINSIYNIRNHIFGIIIQQVKLCQKRDRSCTKKSKSDVHRVISIDYARKVITESITYQLYWTT